MSLVVVEAPEYDTRYRRFHKAIFMAGGITGCPNWQHDALKLFDKAGADCIVYNPRRANFPIHDRSAAAAQIAWEHKMLREADAVMFWFCPDTVQPIVLYELGAWSMTPKPIFVGVHTNYERKADVYIQTELARPDVVIVPDLITLVAQVCDWLN